MQMKLYEFILSKSLFEPLKSYCILIGIEIFFRKYALYSEFNRHNFNLISAGTLGYKPFELWIFLRLHNQLAKTRTCTLRHRASRAFALLQTQVWKLMTVYHKISISSLTLLSCTCTFNSANWVIVHAFFVVY